MVHAIVAIAAGCFQGCAVTPGRQERRRKVEIKAEGKAEGKIKGRGTVVTLKAGLHVGRRGTRPRVVACRRNAPRPVDVDECACRPRCSTPALAGAEG